MVKTIMIEGHQVDVDTSAGWFYEYMEQFGHDIMPKVMPVAESVLAAVVSVLKEKEAAVSEPGSTGLGAITEKDILAAMENDALVDAFIKISGMEFTTVLNIFWAMAKNHDEKIEGPKRFYKGLGAFPWDTMAPQILRLIIESSVSSKNAKSLLEKIDKLTEKINGMSTSTPSLSLVSTEG